MAEAHLTPPVAQYLMLFLISSLVGQMVKMLPLNRNFLGTSLSEPCKSKTGRLSYSTCILGNDPTMLCSIQHYPTTQLTNVCYCMISQRSESVAWLYSHSIQKKCCIQPIFSYIQFNFHGAYNPERFCQLF